MKKTVVCRRYKWYSLGIVLAAYSFLLSIAAMNYLVDPYGVFSDSAECYFTSCNERLRKVEYLLTHRDAFNALLLGSSRVGIFSVEDANKYFPGYRFYNLSFFAASLPEILETVKALDSVGFTYSKVIVGIDLYDFISPTRRGGGGQISHPVITGESPIILGIKYLFRQSAKQSLLAVMGDGQDIVFNFKTGEYRLPRKERELSSGTGPPVEERLRKRRMPHLSIDMVSKVRARSIATLRELTEIFIEKGLDFTFFVHPLHENSEMALFESLDQIDGLIRQIDEATNGQLVSFVGVPWVKDPNLWYDPVHYRPVVATKILAYLATRTKVQKVISK